jgi:beta-fructofuranosidase
LTGELLYEGDGKCGMVLHLDEDGDGYYISLDLLKGIVQIRAWGHKRGQEAEKVSEEAFYYEQLQAAHYTPADGVYPFQLLAYEQYVEFSFHGRILLTLADDTFRSGRVGFYVEGGRMQVGNLELHLCQPPQTKSYPEDMPNY